MWKPNFMKRAMLRKQAENGEMNAQRFVRTVCYLCKKQRHITMFPYGDHKRNDGERFGWRWMQNAQWRARVLQLLADKPVKAPAFEEPDKLEGWTFHAVSTVGVPLIELVELGDAI